ncbi:MAG: ABC transporter ATP-binding protein, partial [Bacilli bacterium]
LRTHLSKSPLLLLDEPFAKLDYITRQSVYQWLLPFIEQRGKSYVLVTHDLDEALRLADRVVVFGHRPKGIVHVEKLDVPQRLRTSEAHAAWMFKMREQLIAHIDTRDTVE